MNSLTATSKFLSAVFLGLCFCSTLSAQDKSAFDIKKHKDTLLDKSALKPIVKSGKNIPKHFLYNQKMGDVQAPLGSYLPAGKMTRGLNNQVIISNEMGRSVFITTPVSQADAGAKREIRSDKKAACFSYLNELSSITKILKPEQEFEIQKIETETNGKTHIRLQQKYKGIKIYGAESIVHLNATGTGEAFNGNYCLIDKNKTLDLQPTISAEEAITRIVTDVSSKTKYRELNKVEKSFLDYEAPSVDTVLYEDKALIKTYLLAYHISIHPNFTEHWEYLVEAKTGKIIEGYKNSCHVDGPRTAVANDLNGASQTINTYQEGAQYILKDYSRAMFNTADSSGQIVTLDANFTYGDNFAVKPIVSANNTDWGTIAVSAHRNSGVAYEYYKNAHGRNSIDGKGGTIYSFINVVDPETGEAFDNAFWNNKFMYYGNGNVDFKPLAGGLDVGGHEMTHGVVQNSANLRYQGESGAINESMADIFGTMMDSTDWLIGEDVVLTSAFPSGALRSLSDPHNGGTSLNNPGYQPRHVNEKYTGSQDNGGVHINSGIPNWAFYKFATAIGSRRKASDVYYRALTVYLTQNSQFIDLRLAIIQSAKDLYGTSASEATEAGLAFDAVGIVDGTGTTGTANNVLPVNPGTEYMLSYDTNTNLPDEGLLRSSPLGTDFEVLLNKSVANKPSVVDNGTSCVFVGIDNRLYTINVDPSQALSLSVLHNSPIWSSVAISKDGNRLAAITIAEDTSIYVVDLVSSQLVRYQLYNPTFTQGVKSAGPIYADAIEWDYSGEYLVYDCYNKITATGQDDITYWDINLIKVWDNTANDFGDGEVTKLFNNLDQSESIGNPAFAKNSPTIIAFDYENSANGTFAIYGLDIETNTLGLITPNNYLGWPCYNKNDNRVAYTGDDGSGNLNVYCVDLNADKISSTGSESGLIANAMWPVYFSVGTRNLSTGIKESNLDVAAIKLYPNPAKNELSVLFPNAISENFNIEIVNQLGQTVVSKSFAYLNGDVLQLNIAELPSGVYSLHIRGNNYSSSQKFIKQDSGSR